MTAKEKYFERGLNSSANCHRGFHNDCIMCGCSCECHQQNAAESLPAEVEQEPVAPVEAKEKERCEFCQFFIPIHAPTCFHHVSEPKPTPSTLIPHEESASWIVSVTASHPAYLQQFEADLPSERSYGVNRISVRRLPQPDSSSISTEPAFEDVLKKRAGEYQDMGRDHRIKEEYEAACCCEDKASGLYVAVKLYRQWNAAKASGPKKEMEG